MRQPPRIDLSICWPTLVAGLVCDSCSDRARLCTKVTLKHIAIKSVGAKMIALVLALLSVGPLHMLMRTTSVNTKQADDHAKHKCKQLDKRKERGNSQISARSMIYTFVCTIFSLTHMSWCSPILISVSSTRHVFTNQPVFFSLSLCC